MTLRTSALALALAAAGALFLPSAAEASHRHSRGCRHDSRYERSYRHDGYRGRSYNRHYYAPRAYRYYAPRPVYRYYAPPPPAYYYYDDYGYDDDGYGSYPSYRYREPAISLHYHSGRPCRRFHVGLNLRF